MRVRRSPVARLVSVITLPFRIMAGFFVFVIHSWASSRQGPAFLKALPALFSAASFFFILLISDWVQTDAKTINRTTAYMDFHRVNSEDKPEHSELFAKKLVETIPDDEGAKYQLGLAFERSDNTVKAVDIMSSIAPVTEEGFPDAHIWLARYYLGNPKTGLEVDQREKLAHKHLDFAISIEPTNQLAHISMAALYIDKSKRDEPDSEPYLENLALAADHLTQVLKQGELSLLQLRALPQLIELRQKLGQNNVAVKQYRRSESRIRSIARKNADVIELWVSMAQSAVLIKDYDHAIEIIDEGLLLAQDVGVKRTLFRLSSQVTVQKAQEFRDMGNREHYRERINGLAAALRMDPTHKDTLLSLLDFVVARKQPTDESNTPEDQPLDFSKADESWLRDSAVGCPVPGVVHALLGISEISKGNVQKGKSHWRIAELQFTQAQLVIRNLIGLAVIEKEREIPNLLDIITLSIELYPDQSVNYQSRGIYHKLREDWEAAISDFNFAIEKSPNLITVHRYLVYCYRQIGNEDKALEHESILQTKLNEMTPQARRKIEAALELVQ